MKYYIKMAAHLVLGILLLTVSISVLLYASYQYNRTEEKVVQFRDHTIDSPYLVVHDTYDFDGVTALSSFFAEEGSLERMKAFNRILHERFTYLEFDQQDMLVQDAFPYQDAFRIDYEWKNYGANDEIGISLKSSQIGKSTYDVCALGQYLAMGEGFSDEAFVQDLSDPIPAILGYEYLGLVDLGDRFCFRYLDYEVQLVIVGFFAKDTSVILNQNMVFLDQSICIPLFDMEQAPRSEEEEQFQKVLYSLKNWGYLKIQSGDDIIEYREQLNELNKSLDLSYVVNDEYLTHSNQFIGYMETSFDMTKGLFFLAALAILLFFAFIFAWIQLSHYHKNRREYAIRMICGCSFQRLSRNMCLGIAAQWGLSLGIAFWATRVTMGYDRRYPAEVQLFEHAFSQTAVITGAVMAVIAVVLIAMMHKRPPYSALNEA